MRDTRLTQIPHPLAYTDALLGWFIRLGIEGDEATLPGLCVAAVAQLSQCELSQLYWLDESNNRLERIAQHLPGMFGPDDPAGNQDFRHEQVLHYVLNHQTALSLEDLTGSVYECGFLPVIASPWRALSCVPLFNRSAGHQRRIGVCQPSREKPRGSIRILEPTRQLYPDATGFAAVQTFGRRCRSAQ